MADRDTGTSDPAYTKLQTQNLPWWSEDIEGQLDAVPLTRRLLETYSKVPPAQVVPHIRAIRQELWNLRAYPCVGLSIFLVPHIKYHSLYKTEILPRLLPASHKSDNAKFLDVGCYIGHDLRALHFDGVPQSSLYGLDILPFWEYGWAFFQDRDDFMTEEQFVIGDILDTGKESEASKLLDGKMGVVWCAAVIHQFSRDKQIAACKRLIQYTKGSGSLIVGAGIGGQEATEVDMPGNEGPKPFRNDERSFKELWEEVGRQLGIGIKADAKWKPWEQWGCQKGRCDIMGPGSGFIEFSAFIL